MEAKIQSDTAKRQRGRASREKAVVGEEVGVDELMTRAIFVRAQGRLS